MATLAKQGPTAVNTSYTVTYMQADSGTMKESTPIIIISITQQLLHK